MGEFSLSELIEKITGYYSEKLALIKTEFNVGKYKNCLLSGDLNRSVEVLQNIMENSLKYGDGRRVELIFPEDDECVQIAITNGGCMLGKDDLPHIFESFWRGANAENIRGSGLGLYVSEALRPFSSLFGNYEDCINDSILLRSFKTRYSDKIVASMSLIGCAKNMPFILKKIGNIMINGIKNTTCLKTVIRIEGAGRLMD